MNRLVEMNYKIFVFLPADSSVVTGQPVSGTTSSCVLRTDSATLLRVRAGSDNYRIRVRYQREWRQSGS